MSLTPEAVENVAKLARLALKKEDIPTYSQELSAILDLVEQLNAADTQNVTPMAHPLDMTQRLRPDAVTETDMRAEFQAIAPAVEDDHFLVPKVIEQG